MMTAIIYPMMVVTSFATLNLVTFALTQILQFVQLSAGPVLTIKSLDAKTGTLLTVTGVMLLATLKMASCALEALLIVLMTAKKCAEMDLISTTLSAMTVT